MKVESNLGVRMLALLIAWLMTDDAHEFGVDWPTGPAARYLLDAPVALIRLDYMLLCIWRSLVNLPS